jgi:DNA-binding transcriptional LysR family regulator
MQLMQLEMFVAVVEAGSVRVAAERVFRTQPAVSIAIRKLEDEISTPLFDRSRLHGFRLTSAGQILYDYATRLLRLLNEATSAVANFSELGTGRLRIGANESLSTHLLPLVIRAFLESHSEIRIEVRCGSSAGLLSELKDRKLDLVFITALPKGRAAAAEMELEVLMRDQLVLITGPQHRFAGQGRVRLRDLDGERLVLVDASLLWRRKMAETFGKSMTPLRRTVENAPIEAIKKLVAMGLGIGFVPLMSVTEEKARGELATIMVEGFHPEQSVYVAKSRSAQSDAAKAFVEVARTIGASWPKIKRWKVRQEHPPVQRKEGMIRNTQACIQVI